MSDNSFSPANLAGASRDEMMSALFAQMVLQQANMALTLMGKVANPHTGETMRDIEAAKMFIDQLEMVEAKTKGNLTADESRLLKQTLMTVRMAFVDAIESPDSTSPEDSTAAGQPAVEAEAPKAEASPSSDDDEAKKKFSKKY